MTAPGGQVLNEVEICAELAERGYKPWEIDKLDRWWIAHIIFHPRGERGELKVSAKKSTSKEDESPFGKFRRDRRRWGEPDWLITWKWETLTNGRRT